MAHNGMKTLTVSLCGIVGVTMAGYLKVLGVPWQISYALGGIVTGWLDEIAAYGVKTVLTLTAGGRALLDPDSIFQGIWIEHFVKSNPERPYSIVRLHYDHDTRSYSATGTPYTADGEARGTFSSYAMSMASTRVLLGARYEGEIVIGEETKPVVGYGEFRFHSRSCRCNGGDGKIFNRQELKGETHFDLKRIDRRWLKAHGLSNWDDEAAIVKTFHAEKTSNNS